MPTILVEATGAGLTDEQVLLITNASAATYGWNSTQNPSSLSCYADTAANISGVSGDTIGYSCRPQANSYASFQWTLALTGRPLSDSSVRGYFRWEGTRNTGIQMLCMATAADGTTMQYRVDISAAGRPSLLYAGGNVWVEPTVAFTANTIYRMDLNVVSAGTYSIRFYVGNSTTPIISATGSWPYTVAVNDIKVGVVNSSTGVTLMSLARWAAGTGGLLGRPSGLAWAAPTVTVPADLDKNVGDTFSLTGVPTLGDGASITAHEWTINEQAPAPATPVYALSGTPSGVLTVLSGAATATITGTVAKAGALLLDYRAQDNTGVWSAKQTVTLWVTPALGTSNKIWPRKRIGSTNWTNISTGEVYDGSDSTGRRSPDNPVAEVETWLMQPVKPGALVHTQHGQKVGVAGISRVVEFYPAPGGVLGTKFYTATISPLDTITDIPMTVDAAGLAQVTTLASLREWAVKITSTKV